MFLVTREPVVAVTGFLSKACHLVRIKIRISSSSRNTNKINSKTINPWGRLMMFSNSLLLTWISTPLHCKSSRFSPYLESLTLSNSLWILVTTVQRATVFFICWIHRAMLPSTVSRRRIKIESLCWARIGSFWPATITTALSR